MWDFAVLCSSRSWECLELGAETLLYALVLGCKSILTISLTDKWNRAIYCIFNPSMTLGFKFGGLGCFSFKLPSLNLLSTVCRDRHWTVNAEYICCCFKFFRSGSGLILKGIHTLKHFKDSRCTKKCYLQVCCVCHSHTAAPVPPPAEGQVNATAARQQYCCRRALPSCSCQQHHIQWPWEAVQCRWRSVWRPETDCA